MVRTGSPMQETQEMFSLIPGLGSSLRRKMATHLVFTLQNPMERRALAWNKVHGVSKNRSLSKSQLFTFIYMYKIIMLYILYTVQCYTSDFNKAGKKNHLGLNTTVDSLSLTGILNVNFHINSLRAISQN